jgi:hypothetical protein
LVLRVGRVEVGARRVGVDEQGLYGVVGGSSGGLLVQQQRQERLEAAGVSGRLRRVAQHRGEGRHDFGVRERGPAFHRGVQGCPE